MEHSNESNPQLRDSSGFILVASVLVIAILFGLATILLLQGRTERLIAVNEYDHIAALGYAEAGLSWAKRRVFDASDVSDLLNGPNNGNASDDYLLGLRDLSLTSSAQITAGNEATKSAVVSRNFDGAGSKNYEVFRVGDAERKALVYVRLDDNYDDNPDVPASNVPLTDTDKKVKVTVVAEYPVFTGASGVEVASQSDRGRARRTVVALLSAGGGSGLMAMSSKDDVDLHSSTTICGDCANVHSNQDVTLGNACKKVSAVGTVTGGTAGTKVSGAPAMVLPNISPYDNIFVPNIAAFNTTGQAVSCAGPSASDPGNSKYFVFVADAGKGLVFKGYWDFVNNRWAWRLIADLNDGVPNELLDACGRTNDEPGYGTLISDAGVDSFYGWVGGSTATSIDCPGSGCAGDASMCVTANNDFTRNGYYVATTANDGQNATATATQTGGGFPYNVAFPGAKAGDTIQDWYPNSYLKDGKWTFGSDTVYSPLRNAVIFVFGNVVISSAAGKTLTPKIWPVSIISYASIEISGNPNIGPANPTGGYYHLLVAGRDIKLNGNLNEDHPTCSGSCPGTPPTLVDQLGGTIIAHEQVEIGGNPDIFGFIYAEDAIFCDETAKPAGGIFTGADTDLHYDCVHPPNPWATTSTPETLWWQERE